MTGDDDAPVGTTTAVSSPVLAAVAPQHWAPSFFGVVPEGGVRRRPGDLVHLLLAIVLIVVCAHRHRRVHGQDRRRVSLGQRPPELDRHHRDLVVRLLHPGRGRRRHRSAPPHPQLSPRLHARRRGVAHRDPVLRARIAHRCPCCARGGWAGRRIALGRLGGRGWRSTTAVLLSAAPYLVRPARRTVHLIQLLALFGAVIAAIGPLGTVLGAVGVGWAIAAVASLVIGTPAATPTTRSVLACARRAGRLGRRAGPRRQPDVG